MMSSKNIFQKKHKKLYGDTDSGVYAIEHPDIYEWMKENKEHFDMSDMVRADLKDNTNKNVVCKHKDEFHGHVPTAFAALNPTTSFDNVSQVFETLRKSA